MDMNYPANRKPLFLPPVRCQSCGHLLGDLWNQYTKKIKKQQLEVRYIDLEDFKENYETDEAKILNEMGLFRYCCRKTILSHPENLVPKMD